MEADQLLIMKKGLMLFNSQHYWECHEELEHHWIESSHDPVRYIYWAVLQTATCLFHWREGNLNGAWGQLNKAYEKIMFVEKNKLESKLLLESVNWNQFKSIVKSIVESDNSRNIDQLKEFKFSLNGNLWD